MNATTTTLPTQNRGSRWWKAGALSTVLVLVVPLTAVAVLGGSGQLDAPSSGLGDPGPEVRWALPAVRAMLDVSLALTTGLLVLAAGILPARGISALKATPHPASNTPATDPASRNLPAGDLHSLRITVVRWAAVAALMWTFAGIATIVLTYADVAGIPVGLLGGQGLVSFVTQFDLGRSLAVSTAAAAVVATGALLATRTTSAGVLTVVSVAGIFPLALTGHSAGAANHSAAVDAQFAHIVALSVWVGGLAGTLLVRKACADAFPLVLRRFSTLAGWCFAIVAISGLIGALVRVPTPTGFLGTYGILLLAKTICLVALGAAGWFHRRRVLKSLHTGRLGGMGAFVRVAAGELLVLATAAGLGIALARTSPTATVPADPTTGSATGTGTSSGTGSGAGSASEAETLLGDPLPPELGLAQWFTQWRLNLLWLVVAIVLVAWYIHAVLRLHRRGDRWPVGRTLFWILGCLLLVWTTSGAPGVYGRVLFSLHMIEHMTVAMVVPFLLVLGAPVTLALRTLPVRHDGSRGLREWLLVLVHSRWMRVVGHPVVASVVFIGGTVVFYYTPLFDLALRTHTGHVLMTVHFLLSGYVFSWMICGIDPGPQRPVYPLRMIILMVSLAFHAFVGIAMMSAVEPLGGSWFQALNRPWGPTLQEDQFRGGALAWALGDYPAALMSTALAVRWIQSDHRERRRYDRQAHRDGDAELRAYNEHLAALHRRSTPQPEPTEDGQS